MTLAYPDSVSTPPGTPVTIPVLANDEGEGLAVIGMTRPDHGLVAFNDDQTLTYTPAAGFSGSDFFSYRARGADGASASAEVRIDVLAPNGQPIARPDQAETGAGGAVAIDVLANDSDADGDALSIVSTAAPGHGTLECRQDETLVYRPYEGFVGSDSFSCTISDGRGGAASALVSLTVHPNRDPVAADDAAGTRAGTAVTINVLGNDHDPDGDDLLVTRVDRPRAGSVALNPDQTITYTPPAGFVGTDSFGYRIGDGRDGISMAQVSVTVQPNATPVAGEDGAVTAVGEPVSIDVLANDTDADGDALRITGLTVPAFGKVALEDNGALRYTPNPGFAGADVFSYTINDAHGGIASADVKVAVEIPNRPPRAPADSAETIEGKAVVINVLANDVDPDGEPLTIVGIAAPSGGSVALNADRTFTYRPAPGFIGLDEFHYTISDGRGGEAVGRVNLTVREAAPTG